MRDRFARRAIGLNAGGKVEVSLVEVSLIDEIRYAPGTSLKAKCTVTVMGRPRALPTTKRIDDPQPFVQGHAVLHVLRP